MSRPVPADRFPAGFLWGAATSAYQIEGSPLADGAGPSNWHRFSHTPGRTLDGETGEAACDHYRRWADDVALMADLGLSAYRFSISWSRVLPAGRGAVNPAGLDFYSRLVDALLSRGIAPCATLFHWDLPAALEEEGGWLHPEIAAWFGDYAHAVFRALGDRVPLWATLNEPWVVTDAGHLHGVHAPGLRSPAGAALAARHLLMAHAAGVRAFRAAGRGKIGIVINLEPKDPASAAPEDAMAAVRADAYMNRQYLDPLFFGRFPEEMAALFGPAWPAEADAALPAPEPLDFLGINYYTASLVRHDEATPVTRARTVPRPGCLRTDMDWDVVPEGLTRVLTWVKERYGDIPLYVTENGAAYPDPPRTPADGRIADPLRVDYLRRHVRAAHEALRRGVDLRGYFVWSLLDNVEWACGTTKRLGIVHVDFTTQTRTPKASAAFYHEVAATNGRAALA
jgi:beta-glucosidase